MEELYKKAKEMIDKAGEILIVSHRKPDGDTLGSAIALKIWFDSLSKQTTLACIDRPSSVFHFLSHVNEFISDFVINDFDLVVIVDAGASYMTNFHLKYDNFLSSGVPIINIDHHSSNDMFGLLNIVDHKAACATLIVYRILEYFKVEIDEDMATALITGIYGDTGAFMHSNTSKEVFEVAGKLMRYGANIADITKSMFKNKPVNMLKLWGRVLQNVHITDENVVISVVKEEDYESADSGPEQLSGVIDYLNMIPDSKFAVLLNEDRKGNVKGSFRTRQEDLDLSRIASNYGGGGHPKASGFMLPGKLSEELKYSVVLDHESKKSLDF